MAYRTRTSFDQPEARRDRRYPLPTLYLVIGEAEYSTANWSLGGFLLLEYDRPAAPGDVLHGFMRFEGTDAVPFNAEIVRIGPEPGQVGARFRELGDPAFDLLDRRLSRRLFGRGG
jgi:hypothetical protein